MLQQQVAVFSTRPLNLDYALELALYWPNHALTTSKKSRAMEFLLKCSTANYFQSLLCVVFKFARPHAALGAIRTDNDDLNLCLRKLNRVDRIVLPNFPLCTRTNQVLFSTSRNCANPSFSLQALLLTI